MNSTLDLSQWGDRIRISILVLALAVTTFSTGLFTQEAFAHSPPSGCTVTSHSHSCVGCGPAWNRGKRWKYRMRYRCSNGNSGSSNYQTACKNSC